jgi:hypothetical protein
MSALVTEKLWCIFLGIKYRTIEVANINQPKNLKGMGYLEKSEYKIMLAAGIIRMVISA